MGNTSAANDEAVPEPGAQTWSVFICYRQDDGAEQAKWLYGMLHDKPLLNAPDGAATPIRLDLYLDQAAPAVDDWEAVHGEALRRARAFVFVASPGARNALGPADWVHGEVDWWSTHRNVAPIVVDLHAHGRYTPQRIQSQWPKVQRVHLPLDAWAQLPARQRAVEEARVVQQILRGIALSYGLVAHEDLARERRAKTRFAVLALACGVLFVVAVALGRWAYDGWGEARTVKAHLEQSLISTRATLALALAADPARETEALVAGIQAIAAAEGRPPRFRDLAFEGLAAVTAHAYVRAALALLPIRGAALSSDGTRLVTVIDSDASQRHVVVWDANERRPLRAYALRVNSGLLALSPDGNAFVYGDERGPLLVSTGDGRTLAELNGATAVNFVNGGRRLRTLNAQGNEAWFDTSNGNSVGPPASLALPGVTALWPDEPREVSAGAGLLLADALSGRPITTPAGLPPGSVYLTWHPRSQRIAMYRNNDRTAQLFDAESGRLVAGLAGHALPITSLRFTADGRRIVTASTDETARVWDAATGAVVANLTGHMSAVYAAGFSRDGSRVVTAGGDSVRSWSAPEWTSHDAVRCFRGPSLRTFSAESGPCGLESEVGSRRADLFDRRVGRLDAPFRREPGSLDAVRAAFSADGSTVAVVFGAFTDLRDANTGVLRARIPWPGIQQDDGNLVPFAPTWSTNGNLIAGLCGRSVTPRDARADACLWDARTGEEQSRLSSEVAASAVALSPDGAWLAVADSAGRLLVRPAGGGRDREVEVSPRGARVTELVFSRDGTILVAVDDEGATLWSSPRWSLPKRVTSPGGTAHHATISADASRLVLVTVAPDGRAASWLFDARSGGLVHSLDPLPNVRWTASAAFSGDGLWVATPSAHGVASVCNAQTGRSCRPLPGATRSVAFSPAGASLLTGHEDGNARLWDAASGRLRATLPGLHGPVLSAEFSPDGRRAVVATNLGAVIYPVNHEGMLRIACTLLVDQPTDVRRECEPTRAP